MPAPDQMQRQVCRWAGEDGQPPPRISAAPGCGVTRGLRNCVACGETCRDAHRRDHRPECRRLYAEPSVIPVSQSVSAPRRLAPLLPRQRSPSYELLRVSGHPFSHLLLPCPQVPDPARILFVSCLLDLEPSA